MNVTDIPNSGSASLDQAVLSRLLEAIPEMSPQLRKAARYVSYVCAGAGWSEWAVSLMTIILAARRTAPAQT